MISDEAALEIARGLARKHWRIVAQNSLTCLEELINVAFLRAKSSRNEALAWTSAEYEVLRFASPHRVYHSHQAISKQQVVRLKYLSERLGRISHVADNENQTALRLDIAATLGLLSEEDRVFIALRVFEEIGLKEVSRRMKIPVRLAKKRERRIIEWLQGRLRHWRKNHD